jgi:diguanylate cyclase (GGDEF)-like protein
LKGTPGEELTTAVVALAAAAALLIVGLIWLGGTRGRRVADARLTHAFEDLRGRMEGLARDMNEALARVETVTRRQRALDDLGSSIDLDDVLARTAEAAALVPGADASVVHTTAHDGSHVVASIGLPQDLDAAQLLNGPPDGGSPRAVHVSYRYEPGRADPASIRAGIGVPLRGESEGPLGFLAVYARGEDALGDDSLAAVESLAQQATPAIENARRYREARQLADTDALTGLHNRRMFHETLGREVARAQRYGRTLGLIVLDLDDFKEINDRYGHLAGDAVLAEVGERMRSVARTADVPCRIGGEEFAVILPESARAEAEALYQRLAEAISAVPIADVGTIRFSAGLAELRAADDALTFFERADRALSAAKREGKNRAVPDGD